MIICVFNYLINKQLGKGKKLVVIFVDLKAAFDTVDRRVSCETMKERRIRERLIGRVKEALRETRSRVKAGGGETKKSFWMAREGKAGMPIESDCV